VEFSVAHDVGRGYQVEGGDLPLTAVDLRLNNADVQEVEEQAEFRDHEDPSSEANWYRNRRVSFWKAKLSAGDTVLRARVAGEWHESKIEKVVPVHVPLVVTYTLPVAQVVCKDSTFLNKRAITRARQHARLWGAGMSAPPKPEKVERHVIRPRTATHLLAWVFRTEFVEVLKMTGHNIDRGPLTHMAACTHLHPLTTTNTGHCYACTQRSRQYYVASLPGGL
jgi:hypothetical protein